MSLPLEIFLIFKTAVYNAPNAETVMHRVAAGGTWLNGRMVEAGVAGVELRLRYTSPGYTEYPPNPSGLPCSRMGNFMV